MHSNHRHIGSPASADLQSTENITTEAVEIFPVVRQDTDGPRDPAAIAGTMPFGCSNCQRGWSIDDGDCTSNQLAELIDAHAIAKLSQSSIALLRILRSHGMDVQHGSYILVRDELVNVATPEALAQLIMMRRLKTNRHAQGNQLWLRPPYVVQRISLRTIAMACAPKELTSTCSRCGGCIALVIPLLPTIRKPVETTMKPLLKPVEFCHTFLETGGIYKDYWYLIQSFFL